MKTSFRVDLGYPAVLEFRGADAVRFLNGQLTQDVRKVDEGTALPSCVTDARGKLQFRVYLTALKESVIWVTAPVGSAEELESRFSRYLIADDVEITDRSGEFQLFHLVGEAVVANEHSFSRKASRFGVEGMDLWVPVDYPIEFPDSLGKISHDELEEFRIAHRAPEWGRELKPGMLPPEAGLEATDISYHKGCYIGQEVISRIKTAGKVNRTLVAVAMDENAPAKAGDVLISGEVEGGELTSVSPVAVDGKREALGYLKRTAERDELYVKTGDGLHEIRLVEM